MHYTTGQWSGLPNYSCTHCPFATLDEAEMLTHIIDRHLAQPELNPEPLQPLQEPEAEIPTGAELPVLVVTPEQLSKLAQAQNDTSRSPRKRARKEH